MVREEWESRGTSQATNKAAPSSPSIFTGPGLAYECLWQGCDYQYEDINELFIHLLESGGHLIKMGEKFKDTPSPLGRCDLGSREGVREPLALEGGGGTFS